MATLRTFSSLSSHKATEHIRTRYFEYNPLPRVPSKKAYQGCVTPFDVLFLV
jgi:hypothetical protein